MRDSLSFRSAAAFASALPTSDLKELKRALRRMPDDVASIFANPLVRQLTTNNPDEMPAQGAVAAALDALSGFALVGDARGPGAVPQRLRRARRARSLSAFPIRRASRASRRSL